MVTRLRKMNYYVNGVLSSLPDDAADEIERLRNTLTVIADAVKSIDGELPGGSAYAIGRIRVELMEALYG